MHDKIEWIILNNEVGASERSKSPDTTRLEHENHLLLTHVNNLPFGTSSGFSFH